MKALIFDFHPFEKPFFDEINAHEFHHELSHLDVRLTPQTAFLARGFEAVVSFANDRVNREALDILKACGVRHVALRCAGFNHVDVPYARSLGMSVTRVPAYSPYAVAEYAVALLLTLNRKIHRSYHRVRDMNFSLDGLVGFDLHGKNIGVVGTGKIGQIFARIMVGFGARVFAYDVCPDEQLAKDSLVEYVTMDEVLKNSHAISLHTPLNATTKHLINEITLEKTRKGVLIINTGRGGLIKTDALVRFLKSGHIGGAALDVYEEEETVFFHDHSEDVLQDDVLARLLTFPNVIITSHQAFLTKEALENIVRTTLFNLSQFEKSESLQHEVGV